MNSTIKAIGSTILMAIGVLLPLPGLIYGQRGGIEGILAGLAVSGSFIGAGIALRSQRPISSGIIGGGLIGFFAAMLILCWLVSDI